jgi:hypothetical protein
VPNESLKKLKKLPRTIELIGHVLKTYRKTSDFTQLHAQDSLVPSCKQGSSYCYASPDSLANFADAVVICDIRLDQTTTLLQKKQGKYALMKQIAAATKNTRQ